MARYYVNGAGFTFTSTLGLLVMVPHGTIFDPGPAGAGGSWQPGPDTHNLLPMDQAAQTALQASVAAQIARTGPVPPPGITELNPNPPIWSP
jgi:hypothetical protein